MATITYPDYPDDGLWAIRLADGSFLKMLHGNMPQLYQYKHRDVQRAARYMKGCRVVPVEVRGLEDGRQN